MPSWIVWHEVVPKPPELALSTVLCVHLPVYGRHLEQQNVEFHTDRRRFLYKLLTMSRRWTETRAMPHLPGSGYDNGRKHKGSSWDRLEGLANSQGC